MKKLLAAGRVGGRALLMCAAFLAGICQQALGQATFTRLGVPGTQAYAMSADGSTVVGSRNNGSGFWWHRSAKGAEILFIPPVQPGDAECDHGPLGCGLFPGSIFPQCVSADGSVVGGSYLGAQPTDEFCSQPFLWSREGGRRCIGDGRWGTVAALTPDGTRGFGSLGDFLHRWTLPTGWQRTIPEIEVHTWGGGFSFYPNLSVAAESPDVICGGIGSRGAFIANLEQETVEYFGSPWDFFASGVSSDGSVAVGTDFTIDGGTYEWSRGDGLIPLHGPGFCLAFAASHKGSIIVGSCGSNAYLWNAARDARDLKQVLASDYGLDLIGWTLRQAISITPDGRTIAGTGRNPEGQIEAWIVDLGIPCNADWNADGAVTSADFFEFLDAFFCEGQACRSADFNLDGVEDSQDFFDFLAAFFTGC